MITEAEAKTKWCPFARVVWRRVDGPHSFNRVVQENHDDHIIDILTPTPTLCMASACMAWRSSAKRKSTFTDEAGPGDGWEKDGEPSPDKVRPGKSWQLWKATLGYCGAFGKPE